MRLFWTGFGAFGAHDSNPASDAARAAEAATPSSIPSRFQRLPVEFDAVETWSAEVLAGEESVLCVEFGLAESREVVSLERTGRNVAGGRPDENGRVPEGGRLEEGGPDRVRTSLPVERLAEGLERSTETGFPAVEVSDDAGTYVCNALYYRTLRRCSSSQRGLFIHIPPMTEPEARSLGERCARVVVEELVGGADGS